MASSGIDSFPPGYLDAYSGHQLVGVAIIFIVLDIFFVGARFLAKTKVVAGLGADDYALLPALPCALACCIISLIGKRCPTLTLATC